jgi:hypothetical protein
MVADWARCAGEPKLFIKPNRSMIVLMHVEYQEGQCIASSRLIPLKQLLRFVKEMTQYLLRVPLVGVRWLPLEPTVDA